MSAHAAASHAYITDSARPLGSLAPNPAASGTRTIDGASMANEAAPTPTAPLSS